MSSAGAFLGLVGGIAAVFGFSKTVLSSRKQDQKLFEQGCVETANLLDAGAKLATRALAWGTFYAFLGTGTLCFGIWKLSGAQNVKLMIYLNFNEFEGDVFNQKGIFFIDGRISQEDGLHSTAYLQRSTSYQPD